MVELLTSRPEPAGAPAHAPPPDLRVQGVWFYANPAARSFEDRHTAGFLHNQLNLTGRVLWRIAQIALQTNRYNKLRKAYEQVAGEKSDGVLELQQRGDNLHMVVCVVAMEVLEARCAEERRRLARELVVDGHDAARVAVTQATLGVVPT